MKTNKDEESMVQSISDEWEGLQEATKVAIMAHQQKAPVSMLAIAKTFENLDVIASTLPLNISGKIEMEGAGKYVIRINRHEIKSRQRFTVAHEIAHFLLHKDSIGHDGIEDNILYRSKLSNTKEFQANRLAADLIMPRHLILSHTENMDIRDEGNIKMIASLFNVSQVAMSIRLGVF